MHCFVTSTLFTKILAYNTFRSELQLAATTSHGKNSMVMLSLIVVVITIKNSNICPNHKCGYGDQTNSVVSF